LVGTQHCYGINIAGGITFTKISYLGIPYVPVLASRNIGRWGG